MDLISGLSQEPMMVRFENRGNIWGIQSEINFMCNLGGKNEDQMCEDQKKLSLLINNKRIGPNIFPPILPLDKQRDT